MRRTLAKLGILPGSFYRWYDRYQTGGVEALEDKPSKPKATWNRIPDNVDMVAAVLQGDPHGHYKAAQPSLDTVLESTPMP